MAALSDIEVSVIIVGYRSRALILDCLQSLYAHTSGVAFEIIVIDNSDDGTAEAVRSRFPRVRIIENKRNLGFGPANNLAGACAKGRYLLLLNPDTLLLDNAIQKLTMFARMHPDAGAWGGVCILHDGRVDPGSYQSLPTFATMFVSLMGFSSIRRWRHRRDEDFAAEVPVLSGAFMMVEADLWRDVGGFDESFKLYSEEVDLCQRIRARGRPVLMTGTARVQHLAGSGSVYGPDRTLAKTRGLMHYIRKHQSYPGQVLCTGILIWVHAASRYLGGVVLSPVLGGRTTQLRDSFGPVCRQPSIWWSGWSGRDLDDLP